MFSPKMTKRLRRFARREMPVSQANHPTVRSSSSRLFAHSFWAIRDTRNACPRAVQQAKMAPQVSERCSRALPAASCLKARDCALHSKSFRLFTVKTTLINCLHR